MRTQADHLRGLTTPPADPPTPLAELWAGWNRFWFAPSDPTTLGFIRICCGILVLYTHIVYSFDLQEFFGPRAWYDQRLTDELRHEGDPTLVPRDDWKGFNEVPEPWALVGTEERVKQVRAVVPVLELNGKPLLSEQELKLDPAIQDKLLTANLVEASMERVLTPEERQKDTSVREEIYRQRVMAAEERKLPLDDQNRLLTNRLMEEALEEFSIKYPEVDPHKLMRVESPQERRYILDYSRRFGVDPDLCYSRGNPTFSVWYHVTDPTSMVVVHIAILVVILLFTLGIGTRVTAVLTWLATVSYINREPPLLFGQDTMQNLLLIYLMIAPCGAALSVDRLLARWWARRKGLVNGADFARPAPRASATFALRMMQINICFIYFAAGCAKLQGHTWWGGTAIWHTMANYSFAPLGSQHYRDFLWFLTEHRWLWELVMTIGVLHTFAVELVFPWVVWSKSLRWVMLILAITLHTGIAIIMGLTVFQMFMITLLLAFFPPQTIHRLVDPLVEGLRGFRAKLPRRAAATKPLVLSKT